MTESQQWRWLVITLIVAVLVYLLSPVLTPFVVSAILAYLADPLVDRLEARKFPRTLAVIVVFTVLFGVLIVSMGGVILVLEEQVAALVRKLPGYLDWFQTTALPWLRERFGITTELDAETLRKGIEQHWQQAGGILGNALKAVTTSGMVMLEVVANLVLIPVVTFYLLRDWDVLMQRGRELLPRRVEPVAVKLAGDSDEVLGAFFRGQLLVMLLLGIIYATGLWIAGLDFAFLIGMVAGLVSFVPYLGFIVGILLAGVAAIMQFHDAFHLLPVFAVFAVGQAVEGMVLTPLLVGDRIGLHPVAVIFAIMAGGVLFGFIGVLLALPVAAVVMVLLRYLHVCYRESDLYESEAGEP